MLDLVIKFVSWVKSTISLIISLPSKIGGFITGVGEFLSFLPSGLGTVIAGLMFTLVMFVIIYCIVKLVVSLL